MGLELFLLALLLPDYNARCGGQMDAEKMTVIDAVGDVEGKLKGKDVKVLGKFRGEMEISGRLTLGEGSLVEAKVRADSAEIAGTFKGDLVVRSLILLEKGRLEGTLDAQSLGVRDGASLNGAVSAGAPRPASPAPVARVEKGAAG
jgi:cytoskeletal protein CcmA (bactofilin family)